MTSSPPLMLATTLVALLLLPPSTALGGEPEPPPPLDLEALVVEALQAHPAVQAAESRAAAAAEVPSRVASPPDPWLSFMASNVRVDAPGLDTSPMTGLVLGVNQGLPFPGLLLRRKELAGAVEQLAMARVASTETMVALRVRDRYWALHFAERALAITEESGAVLDSLADVVTARFSVGQGAQQDALQVQVAEGRLRSMLEARREGLRTARRDLAAAVGREPSAPMGVTDAPPAPPTRDPDGTLQAFGTANPELGVARQEVARTDAAIREARSALAPTLGAGFQWRFRGVVPGDASNGADMVSAGLQISLPVWAATKQTAAVRERRAQNAAATAAEEDLRLALETELQLLVEAHAGVEQGLELGLESEP